MQEYRTTRYITRAKTLRGKRAQTDYNQLKLDFFGEVAMA